MFSRHNAIKKKIMKLLVYFLPISYCFSMSEVIPNTGPTRNEFGSRESRLRSFACWPLSLPQKPPQLADAGFFYLGRGDHVQCFFCDGGLKGWDPTDQPWTEHARWFPKCSFLLLKKGQDFVQSCRRQSTTNELLSCATPNLSSPVEGEGASGRSGGGLKNLRVDNRIALQDGIGAPSPVTLDMVKELSVADLEAENARLKDDKKCSICMDQERRVSKET